MTLRSIASALCASLGLSMATTLVSMTLIAASLDYLDSLESLAQFRSTAKIVQMSCYLLTGVLFLIWTYRLVSEFRASASEQAMPTPQFAVISYFIPGLNFVLPYFTYARVARLHLKGAALTKTLRILRVWWLTWILANFSAWSATFLTVRAATAQQASMADQWALVPDFLFLICCASAIATVSLLCKPTHSPLSNRADLSSST